MRSCRKCGIPKPESEFYENSNEWRPCRECVRTQRRAYHAQNKIKENDYARNYLSLYYELNRDAVKAKAKAYYEMHKSEILLRRKQRKAGVGTN